MTADNKPQFRYLNTIITQQVKIPAGSNVAETFIECGGMIVARIDTDSNFTASSIRASGSSDQKNYIPIYPSDGFTTGLFSLPASANQSMPILTPIFWTYNRVIFSTSISQVSDTILTIALAPFIQGIHR
jgi:hypothetical protein